RAPRALRSGRSRARVERLWDSRRACTAGGISRRGAWHRVAPDVTSRVLHALQALLRLGVLREDGQRPLVHLRGLVLLPAILEQECLRIERQRLRRDLTEALTFYSKALLFQDRGQKDKAAEM